MAFDLATVLGAYQRNVFWMVTNVGDNKLTEWDNLEVVVARVGECGVSKAGGHTSSFGRRWHFRVGKENRVFATLVLEQRKSSTGIKFEALLVAVVDDFCRGHGAFRCLQRGPGSRKILRRCDVNHFDMVEQQDRIGT